MVKTGVATGRAREPAEQVVTASATSWSRTQRPTAASPFPQKVNTRTGVGSQARVAPRAIGGAEHGRPNAHRAERSAQEAPRAAGVPSEGVGHLAARGLSGESYRHIPPWRDRNWRAVSSADVRTSDRREPAPIPVRPCHGRTGVGCTIHQHSHREVQKPVAQREIHLGIRPRPDLEIMIEQAALTALNDRNWPLTAALADALGALQTDREQKWTHGEHRLPACPRPAAHTAAEYTGEWPPTRDVIHFDIHRGIVIHDFDPVPNQSGAVSDTTPCRRCGARRTDSMHLDPIGRIR